VVELFLWLQLDTAFRMRGIVCNLSRGQGQIFSLKVDVRESQPNRIMKRGKRRCILRLQYKNPSLQRWLFHVFRVFAGLQRVPKLCVRYVHQQLGVWFENQGQLAKNSPLKINKIDNIRVSALRFCPQDILG
jgi:hypothetical protein